MEVHHQQQQSNSSINANNISGESSGGDGGRERSGDQGAATAVRSRWTPKPEQILILESIFNSGMVNPPKEETVRIRKLLEKFGAVGDANVFYWFQNRRSRSRRRQRQLQAASAAATTISSTPSALPAFGSYSTCTMVPPTLVQNPPCPCPSSDNSSAFVDDVFTASLPSQMQMGGFPLELGISTNASTSSIVCTTDVPNLDFSSLGIITVFINGVATQVPEGPLDMKTMFGEELILVRSSGVTVPFNEYGISFQSLQHGESYFLVPRLA